MKYKKLILILIPLVLFGCVNKQINSIYEESKAESYVLGKFKIKTGTKKENGYFSYKQGNGAVTFSLGKSYLMPEKRINFSEDFKISLSDIFKEEIIESKYLITGQELRGLLMGKPSNSFKKNFDVSFTFSKNLSFPNKILIKTNKVEITLIINEQNLVL